MLEVYRRSPFSIGASYSCWQRVAVWGQPDPHPSLRNDGYLVRTVKLLEGTDLIVLAIFRRGTIW